MQVIAQAPDDGVSSGMNAFPWLKSYPKGIEWGAPIDFHPVSHLLDEAVKSHGPLPAMDFIGKKWTYNELNDLTNRAAAGFQQRGIGKGSHVGLMLPNCPYYVIAYYALLRIGATVVNFNPLYAEQELIHQVTDSRVDVMVTLDVSILFDKAVKVMNECRLRTIVLCKMADALPWPKNWLYPVVRAKEVAKVPYGKDWLIPFGQLIANDGKITPVDINPLSDVAVLQYTGGTTGTPKGAMLTHANLTANAEQAFRWLEGSDVGGCQERMLAAIPFFHVFAMTAALNFAVRLGAEIIMMPRFSIDELMKLIRRTKPTIFPAVPTIYNAVCNHKDAGSIDMTSIKACISGGAPLPQETYERFTRLTGAMLVEGYGLSETSPVACVGPVIGKQKPGSIGMPVPGTQIDIVSLEDRTTRMPQGERGEICIKGPQVMMGYWNKPDDTAMTLVDGFLHTGDVGYIDEDGYIFIVDRIKDLIIAGGFNIYPRRVEEAIYQHPAIEECVVGGVPDPYRGETVKAWIKLLPDQTLDADELKGFLKDKLSPIEIPKIISFRDEPLPKTLIGKLSRKALIEEERAKLDT